MDKLAKLIAVVICSALVLAGCATDSGRAGSAGAFTFGLFGDLAYLPEQEPSLENVLTDLNSASLEFVVHVGDLGGPRYGSCSNELWARRKAQFDASMHPLIYTPGDNEWTDCHDAQGVPGGDPLERLTSLRAFFFQGEHSLGRRALMLKRQSQSADPLLRKYRENARWVHGDVTFMTLHVVGSNNGFGFLAASDVEHAERNRVNMTWLREGFAAARANNSRAIMIIQQANIFPEVLPYPGKLGTGSSELRALLEKETIAFGKTVVLVHGDSHYFRIDKPLGRRPNVPAIENFTRVETFGQPNHHWLHVTVDPDDPNVFIFRQRIVASNIMKRQ
jgi:hypothetical protein